MKIFLTGIMGSGKSTVGEQLTHQLGWTFIDVDNVIEVQAGKSISEIFREDGEAHFRSVEKEVIRKLLSTDDAVIALGGGALEDAETRETVQHSGKLIWLQINPEVAARRLSNDQTRPLLSGVGDAAEELRNILRQRKENYAKADLKITVDKLSAKSVTTKLMDLLNLVSERASLKQIPTVDEYDNDVIIGQGMLTSLGEYLRQYDFSTNAALITDSNVSQLYQQQVAGSLKNAGFSVTSKVLPAGEATKNLESLEELYTHFSEAHLDRKSPVIALGGGVIGDLAGYFAASYLRGIPLVHLPTSLLAQVDSSIGGKVGINLPAGKNLVGAFYKPTLVFSDVNTLYTLPEREWRTGLGEVLKYGFIGNPEIFELLESGEDFTNIVTICIQRKLNIVQQDFKEGGLRKILNFGHTLGHALEQVTHYNLVTHGEAVYWGMIGALSLSNQAGKLSTSALETSLGILKRFDFRLPPFDINPGEIFQALRSDKKRVDGTIHWVLLEDIGKPIIATDVDNDQISRAIEIAQEFVRK